jgi:hypothetical protein
MNMDFNKNLQLSETISANYFAMHGTNPDGYDPTLSTTALCGMNLKEVEDYAPITEVRKVVKEINIYYKNLPITEGLAVTYNAGRMYGGFRNGNVIIKSNGHLLVTLDPYVGQKFDYMSYVWVKAAKVKARPLVRGETFWIPKTPPAVGTKVDVLGEVMFVIKVEGLKVIVSPDPKALYGLTFLTEELKVLS